MVVLNYEYISSYRRPSDFFPPVRDVQPVKEADEQIVAQFCAAPSKPVDDRFNPTDFAPRWWFRGPLEE